MTLALAWGCRTAYAVILSLFPILTYSAETAASPVAAPGPITSAVQMLFGLGIVIAAIIATAWALKRLTPGQTARGGDLRVVAAVAVGPKERVVLVDVSDARLVLGVAAGQVTLLRELPRPVDSDLEPGKPAGAVFVEKLREMMAKRGENK